MIRPLKLLDRQSSLGELFQCRFEQRTDTDSVKLAKAVENGGVDCVGRFWDDYNCVDGVLVSRCWISESRECGDRR